MAIIENKGEYGVTHIFEAKQGNMTISTIVAAGDAAIGIAIADYDHDGKIPKDAANWGSYENNCFVRVATGARVIKTVQLEASNSAVSAGNYIKVGTTTAGCYDKSSGATDAIALEDASANSGAKIQVAFGVMNII